MINIRKYSKSVLFLSLLVSGCYDIFKSKETKIVGDISVIDSNDQNGGNYSIVIKNKDGYNEPIVYDYVVDLFGNDSTILIKTLDQQNCRDVFYLINHNNGHQPATATKIASIIFINNLRSYNKKYLFHTDHQKCP